MTKIAGSGSISQSHGSADPDPDPDLDPHLNVTDPQHWLCDFFDFLYLKNDVNVASKSNKDKKLRGKKFFSCHLKGH
jgi:hypothetical protein